MPKLVVPTFNGDSIALNNEVLSTSLGETVLNTEEHDDAKRNFQIDEE